MARRPAQGRGSGGRVTPPARSTGSSGRGRVLKADEGKAKARRPSDTGAPRRRAAEPTGGGADDAPARPFSLARLFNPAAAAGVPPAERQRPWWGFGDAFAWYLLAAVLGGLVALAVSQALGYTAPPPIGPGARVGEATGHLLTDGRPRVAKGYADMPLWLSQGLLMVPFWALLVGGCVWATVRKGFGPVRDLKIAIRPVDVPVGLAIGVVAQLVLNPLLYRLLFVFTGEQDVSAGARGIAEKATSPLLIVLLYVTVGFLAPVAEELFFRGLTLQSLIRRFGPALGIVASSAFFAVVHTNPLYFVALMPFALILAWLVQRFDRLGPAIAAHVGYNLVTATVLVFQLEPPL